MTDIEIGIMVKNMAREMVGEMRASAKNAGFYDDMKDKISRIKSDRARHDLLRYLENYKNAQNPKDKARYEREITQAYSNERYKEQ